MMDCYKTTPFGREYTAEVPLKNGKQLNAGYSYHLYHRYDARKLRRPPFSLKEWDFYQINDDNYVLQMTIGHVSYCGSVSATLFSLTDERRYTLGSLPLFPRRKIKMPSDGEHPYLLKYADGKLNMTFDVKEDVRLLTLHSEDGTVDIKVTLTNCGKGKQKTVVAIPFKKSGQFYLNYKENCFVACADVRFGDFHVTMQKNCYGLLDWGRGVWPFKHSWTWGNGSCLADGKLFGFNIGWGFGDTSCGNENMFFYDNKAYKLDKVVRSENADGTLRFADNNGTFDFTATRIKDNYTTTKMLWVNNACHQVFYRFCGKVVVDGKTVEIPSFVAFCEDAVNRW